MGKLTGKVAVVTGAARGLGRAYALHLASIGADVAVVDKNLRSFEEFKGEADLLTADTVMDEIREMGVKSVGYELDVTDQPKVEETIDAIVKEFGRIDIVVCNAGGGSGKTSENSPSTLNWEQFDTVVKRNFYGTAYTINAAAKIMKKQRSGKIITVSSQHGFCIQEGGNYSHYSSAKAAIMMLTKCAAMELGEYGINVNGIAPGYIGTGRIKEVFLSDVDDEWIKQRISLCRVGTPEDCAKVIEFLSTDLSDYVTGEIIKVNGQTTDRLV